MEDWGRGKGGPLACHLADRKEAFTIIGRGEGLGMPPGPRKTPAWKRTLLIKGKKKPTSSSFQRKTCGKVIFTSFWLWFCRVSPAGWACQATCEPPLSFSSVNAGGFTGKSAAWIFNGVNMGSGLECLRRIFLRISHTGNIPVFSHSLRVPTLPIEGCTGDVERTVSPGQAFRAVFVQRGHVKVSCCGATDVSVHRLHPWRASSLREPLDAASN